MAATARLVVQMSPEEKKSLDARARRAGISTAEFVRRRIEAESLDDERPEIEALLAALENVAPTVLDTLDKTIMEASALISALDARRP
jgi:hypothetical protein